jgi:hypothetical protein
MRIVVVRPQAAERISLLQRDQRTGGERVAQRDVALGTLARSRRGRESGWISAIRLATSVTTRARPGLRPRRTPRCARLVMPPVLTSRRAGARRRSPGPGKWCGEILTGRICPRIRRKLTIIRSAPSGRFRRNPPS